MPKLLMITYHFPPSAASGGFRLLGFAQHLPAFGWDTIVIAPPGLPWEPSDPALAARVPQRTTVIPVPYPRKAPKLVRWLAPFAVWLPYARRAARRAVNEHWPDAVLTSGPPHWAHLIGRYLQRRYKLPWVADFRDPWVTESFTPQSSGIVRRLELSCERRVMHKANLILHNAPNACALLRKAYPRDADRMTYLTNGYDPENFPPQAQAPANTPLRVLHAGELYVGRDPRPLLDAVAQLPADVPAFRLEFMGRTEYESGADLLSDARSRGVEARVLCRPQTSYQQSLAEMAGADVLLLMDSPGRKLGVPAKLYEYLGAGRPILAVGEPDGDLAALLGQSGVMHRLVRSTDVPAIRTALAELVTAVAAGTAPLASDEARLKFSRRSLAGQLAGMLDGLQPGTPSRAAAAPPREVAPT
jgi:glycosyltransferase involved in cell wall biosynthesis